MKVNQEQEVDSLNFEGKAVLGEGAEGTVLLADVERFGGEIALKVFDQVGGQKKVRERTVAKTEYTLLRQLDACQYVIQAAAYIQSGEISRPGDFGTRVMKDKEMIALELCPHGDLFSLVSDHRQFLEEN